HRRLNRMFSSEFLINIFGLGSIIAIIALIIALAYKMDRAKQLQMEFMSLKKSLDEMDEQAKLIVRTDMELNKTQEELDKKITGLYALQRLSRAISTTLEESQIFKMIEATYLEDLGFEKACGFLWDEAEKKFQLQVDIGYVTDEIEAIQSSIDLDKEKYLRLIKSEKAISSITSPSNPAFSEKVKHAFKAVSFIIAPILPKEGNKGFLIVGTQNLDTVINEGDEELITILTNQLGQALENARLFENTWLAHQDLEKKVEERTRELTRVLEEVRLVSKRKSDFVSSVSHELRTPLTSIKGYASILLSQNLGALPEPVRQRLEKINIHSDELTKFVNDLLDISRIESGRVSMKRMPSDLKHIVEEAVDLMSVIAKDKQIGLTSDLPQDTQSIFVDSSQIKRVFINLINNAIKFTPPKGKINIKCHKLDNKVQVDITDTGCGIPEEAVEKIFEEFYRVDNLINQEVKGTGLGLALVKNIIEAHDGKIWVKSKAGAGSTFSFTLPTA
ncbi:MAG: ATP-binding protein, partial [Candidatus Omnitrophica bacterium]|nr:ATP-binding protein [Candidatus Omnitrophota bacterium]